MGEDETQAIDALSQVTQVLRQSSRSVASTAPERLAALAKDMGVLVKLLRNPAESPEEPKFRKIKLANATVARVLNNEGVRDVLQACGFVGGEEHLELGDVSSTTIVGLLLHAAKGVEAVQQMLQELHWLHTVRNTLPSLSALPWEIDGAAKLVVQTCLRSLHIPTTDTKAPWVQRIHYILSSPEMHECRMRLTQNIGFAVPTLRSVALALIKAGGHDLQTLVLTNRCVALIDPPGDKATLEGRLDFCFACLAAALPEHDELMELRLKLEKKDLLFSTIDALSSFSEMGVRCGVLKQELKLEYHGEEGQDAGGLRRQFFDMFTSELKKSKLWTQTALGSLRPVDEASVQSGAGEVRQHMETCGRVCGMALIQELHRRSGEAAMMDMLDGHQPPNLFGHPFALYFIRVVQQNPPASLTELQAELRAESLETHPDYRAGSEILTRSLTESGLGDARWVRAVGELDVPLVDGGADLAVTEDNKLAWLETLLRCELVNGYAEAAVHFRRGFQDVVGMPSTHTIADPVTSRWTTPHFFMLTAEELQLQWSGAPISHAFIDELRRVAVVHPDVQVQAGWLWDIMQSLDDEKRAMYYRFVTGSSRRPSGGLSDLKIGPKAGGDGAYPFAHACAGSLDMPSYSSLPVLRERLEVAVETAHDTFTDL